jgi:hypothetical protein
VATLDYNRLIILPPATVGRPARGIKVEKVGTPFPLIFSIALVAISVSDCNPSDGPVPKPQIRKTCGLFLLSNGTDRPRRPLPKLFRGTYVELKKKQKINAAFVIVPKAFKLT